MELLRFNMLPWATLLGEGEDLGKAEGLEPALMYCLRAIWDIFGVDIIHGPNTNQDGY